MLFFKDMLKKLNQFWFFLVLISYLFFSFQTISLYKSAGYDLDEIFSYDLAQSLDLTKPLGLIDRDLGNPPLFFILLKPWVSFFTIEWSARLISFIFFSFVFLFFLKILNQLKLPNWLKLVGALLFMGVYYQSPIINYLRPYTLFSLLTLVTVYLTFSIKSTNWQQSLLLIFSVIAGFLTHYIYWFFYLFWFLSNLFYEKKFSFRIKSLCLGFIAVSPVILHLLIREIFTPPDYNFIYQVAHPWPGFSGWLFHLTKFSILLNWPSWIAIVLWLIFLIYLFSRVAFSKSVQDEQKVLSFFVVMSWSIYLFSSLHNYLSNEKYLNFMVPFIIISFVLLLQPLEKKISGFHQITIVFLLLIWSFSINSASFYNTIPMNSNWKDAVTEVSSAKDFLIVSDCVNLPGLNYYLPKENEIFAFSQNNCGLSILPESTQRVIYIAEFELDQKSYLEGYHLDKLSEHGYVKVGYLEKKN